MKNKLAQKSNHFVNILLKRVTYQKDREAWYSIFDIMSTFCHKKIILSNEKGKTKLKGKKTKKGEKEWNWMKLSPNVGA